MASNCEGNILAHAEFSSTSKMLDYSPLLMSIVCVPVFVYCNYNQPVLLAPLALYILSCSPFLLPIGSNTLLVRACSTKGILHLLPQQKCTTTAALHSQVQTLACVGSTWAFSEWLMMLMFKG